MGDRASIELVYPTFTSGDKSVWIYTHWGATDFPTILAGVLGKHERWDDEPYLGRMIASAVFKYAGIDDTTGAGLAPEYQDGVKWRIHLGQSTVEQPGGWGGDSPNGTLYSFDEFLLAAADPDHSFEYGDD
jgi:hypothetical protein